MTSETSGYSNIDHPIDRSLLGTCGVTLLFLVVSLALFGPFIAILVPALVVASIARFVMNIVFCDPCHPGQNITNNEYYSPDQYLSSEEARWLKGKSKIIILMILDGAIDLSKLQSIFMSRLILARKDDSLMNPDSVQPHTVQNLPSNSSQLLYPKFSQRICKSTAGWKWKFDDNFDIENHFHELRDSDPTSTLTNPDKLSELISRVHNLKLNLERPPWDSYIVSATDITKDASSQANKNHCIDKKSSQSMIIFRLHPSLSDGVSLVHVLCASLSDEQYPVELKDRFHSSGKFLNSIRALFIGPVVFIQKWLLTRRDCNIFHPSTNSRLFSKPMSSNNSAKVSIDTFGAKETNDRENFSFETPINTTEEERLFHFSTYSLSIVSRIKGVTRSTFTEIFLASVAGALRTYQQQISKIQHPYDLLCLLPADLTKERHTSVPCRNSSSMVSKTSNQSSTTDILTHISNNYSLVDFGLPTNTEGMIPRLWEVKQRMEELKNSADSIILCGLSRILKHLFPEIVGRKLMKTYYNKNSLSIVSLQGPESRLYIDGKQISDIIYWFPSLFDVSMSMSCFSYGDSFTCSVSGDSIHLPRIGLILDAVAYQMDLLNKLLENRRIPGEHKSQRFATAGGDEPKVSMNIGKFDTNEKERTKNGLSTSISSDHLYTRLSSIQNQLQNDKGLSDEDLDTLRSEFSNLMGILRRRKSCGIDTNGEMADFDEEIEEMSDCQTGGRRPSLPGLMVLSTRRRSLATSLTRPLSTGHRSRSNSKAALQSSNCLVSPSCSSSKRPSLRFPDDVESGFGPDQSGGKMETRFMKHDKSKSLLESSAATSDNTRSSPQSVASHSAVRTDLERNGSKNCREDRV